MGRTGGREGASSGGAPNRTRKTENTHAEGGRRTQTQRDREAEGRMLRALSVICLSLSCVGQQRQVPPPSCEQGGTVLCSANVGYSCNDLAATGGHGFECVGLSSSCPEVDVVGQHVPAHATVCAALSFLSVVISSDKADQSSWRGADSLLQPRPTLP